MKLPLLCRALVFLAPALVLPLRAAITLATPFRDDAVLQRDKPLPVWGLADPQEKISVQFHGQTKATTAGADGRWQVTLDPIPASADPAELVVQGKSTVTIKDVLVGDVWLCSGQSNMFLAVRLCLNPEKEAAAANHPLIRHFNVKSVVSEKPLEYVDGVWEVCTPQTVREFTATGYFFGRDLQEALHVPIGIIKATLGGSPVEGWISAPALASNPAFTVVAERWEKMRPNVQGGSIRNEPSGLYNGLIYPLEPFAIKGFVWYQGEGNAPRANEYSLLFRTMITQWRKDFRQGDLPFFFVQLPNYPEPKDTTHETWAWLRENQAAALALPNTGMAVTLDIGDNNNLHPANKQEVGRRLSLIALARVYGRSVEYHGPTFASATREGAAIRVRFDHAQGLHLTGDPSHAFLLAGADKKFVPAQAKIDGESVLVSADGLPAPESVRFEWTNAPDTILYNAENLPAAPFRTDK